MTTDSTPFREITDTDDLARSCERWRCAPALAIDTEFARERTFHPVLGLIQLSDGHENVLIDPLPIGDLTPLADLLTAPEVDKILHSCSEDLEVFHHHFGIVLTPLVDTQIAAAMAGLDYSMGYARLVETLKGVSLPKAQTRSDWLRRPLTDAQKQYAALDVAYLLDCHHILQSKLEDLGRKQWLIEDCARMTAPDRFRIDDQATYRKLARGRRLRKHQLVVLWELCMWREREARERDLPRNFVLREAALGPIALRRPSTLDELMQIRELDRREVQRHGKTLLRLVAEARARPVSEQPEPLPAPLDLRPYKELVSSMKEKTQKIASELEIPKEVLASKRHLEMLTRQYLEGKLSKQIGVREGWRNQVIGEPLLSHLRRKLPPPHSPQMEE